MAGNPVGQAAWILERFHDWADLRTRSFEEVFSLDDLITNLMLYVMTDAFPTSVRYYRAAAVERFALPAGMRVETPTAVANFPGEDLYAAPPRAYADKAYRIVRWTDMPRGGHFAAMEEPELFVEEIRAFGRATN
jgi:microsomal epoxide hydrolase